MTEHEVGVALRVARLGAELYQLDARASLPLVAADTTAARAAHRAQALLLGVRPALLALHGAVVSGTDVLGGGLVASGRDTVPPGWSCTVPGHDVPAIVAPFAALVEATLAPPDSVWRDEAAAAASSLELAPADTLAPRHTAPLELTGALTAPAIAPVADGTGACATGPMAPHNWGDPARPSPCAAYVPVVRVKGDLVAPSGRGQGVLLVEGDLDLAGGYEHWGVVVVQGEVRATGVGDRVVGALLARGGITAGAPGALEVRHSSCAVRAALVAAGTVTPVTGASWREWW